MSRPWTAPLIEGRRKFTARGPGQSSDHPPRGEQSIESRVVRDRQFTAPRQPAPASQHAVPRGEQARTNFLRTRRRPRSVLDAV